METINKYPLALIDEQEVLMPVGANILCVQVQDGQPVLWAVIETTELKIPRRIAIVTTGRQFDELPKKYIGTVQLDGFVLHFFDLG